MNNFNNKNSVKEAIGVIIVAGLMGAMAQILFAQTTTATAPVISNVRVENIMGPGAQIKWTTDHPADSYATYSMSSGGSTFSAGYRCDDGGYVLQHCINLMNLSPSTSYSYKVESHNAMNMSASANGSFFSAVSSTTSSGTTSSTTSGVTSTIISMSPASTTFTFPPIPIQIPYFFTSTVKREPIKNEDTASAPTTTQVPASSVVAVTSGSEPIKSKVILNDSGKILDEEEVRVKIDQVVRNVELRLSLKGNPESFYLGQARFDMASGQWVFKWDSTQTPNGQYVLFPLITTNTEVSVRGDEKIVVVKNEKMVETTMPVVGDHLVSGDDGILAMQPTTSVVGSVLVNDKTISTAEPIAIIDPVKFIEQIKKEKKQEEEQMKKEMVDVLVTQSGVANSQTTDPNFREVATKKIEDLKIAIAEGNNEKKDEIVADIIDIVTTGAGGATQNVLAKDIEARVAKLEQVAIEQKTGVVDEKNFSVDTVKVAEVVTKPDGAKIASKLEFSGKALPNSFATVYIFSIPIVVTVKTDKDGYWNYTLDKELEDGEHQVFVAITDVKGAVVAKSNLLPFVKEASAVTVEQMNIAPAQQDSPSFVADNYFYGSVIVIILIVVAIFVLLGINRRNTPQQ